MAMLLVLFGPLAVRATSVSEAIADSTHGGCTATITPSAPQVCSGSTFNTASGPAGATSYAWSIINGVVTNGFNSQTMTYTAGSSGVVGLNLSLTHPGGGSSCGSLNVPIVAAPATPTITPGGPTTFCLGGSVTLTSSSASGNQWYLDGNPIGGATSQTYVATSAGSYTVDVSNTGCTGAPSAPITVTVNPTPPTPTITPSGPTTFCSGGSVTLTSSASSGNQWYQGGNLIGGASSQTFITNAAGSYSVSVTTNGCTSAASSNVVITVNPLPSASISGPSSIVTATAGIATVPNAGVGASYAWTIGNGSINGGNNTTNINFTAGVPGPMSLGVDVTNASSCTANGSLSPTVISDVLFQNGFE